jgi:hypothetical protein
MPPWAEQRVKSHGPVLLPGPWDASLGAAIRVKFVSPAATNRKICRYRQNKFRADRDYPIQRMQGYSGTDASLYMISAVRKEKASMRQEPDAVR